MAPTVPTVMSVLLGLTFVMVWPIAPIQLAALIASVTLDTKVTDSLVIVPTLTSALGVVIIATPALHVETQSEVSNASVCKVSKAAST